MKRTGQAPIKVYDATKERLRLLAAIEGRSQAEVVESAVEEYLERHVSEIERGIDRARRSLGRRAQPLLDLLQSRRAEILDAAARHGAREVRVFGSVARGEGHAASDVDLLVELEAGRSLLDQAALRLALEEILGRRVDVVEPEGLHPLIRDRVLSEAIPL